MALGTPVVLLDADSARTFGTGAYAPAASAAPTPGSKLIAHVVYCTNGGGDPGVAITCADGGAHTWSEPVAQHRRTGDGANDWIGEAFFVADNVSNTAVSLSVDTSAGTIYAWEVELIEIPGGLGATVGATGSVSSTGNGAVSITLSGAPGSASYVIAGLGTYETNDNTLQITAGGAFTETVEAGKSVPNAQIQHRTGSTSTAVDWSDNGTSVTGYLGLAFELIESTSGITTTAEWGTSLGATNAQTLPSGSTSGDLILGFVGHDNPGATAITVAAGYTILDSEVQGSNVIKGAVFARVLDGSGSDTLTVSGTTEDYVVGLVRVAAANHGVTAVATDIKIGKANNSTGNADPPSLNAGSSNDWQWFAVGVVDLALTTHSITVVPTNYTALALTKSASSSSSVALGLGYRQVAASTTEDPGTFTNTSRPWIGFTVAVPPAASGTTGTIAVTAGADTSSGAGTPKIVGTVAVTSGADVSAASGKSTVFGTVAVTAGADTSSAAGSGKVVGTIAVTAAADTSSAAGTPKVTGTIAVTAGADVGVASDGGAVTGTIAVTQAADTSSAAGTPRIVGTISVTAGTDTPSAAGAPKVTGTLAVTQAADTPASTGSPKVTGSIAATQAADTASATGTPRVVGTISVTAGGDVMLSIATGNGPVVIGWLTATIVSVERTAGYGGDRRTAGITSTERTAEVGV